MTLLAFDASGNTGTIAVMESGRVLASEDFNVGLWQGRELMLRLNKAMEKAGRGFRDIETVAVGVGPGSYTGLRVSVATAKTLAWSTGAGLVGVPTLDALAANAPASCGRVAAVIDARRGEVYAGVYNRENSRLVLEMEYEVLRPPELAARLAGGVRTRVVGDAALLYREVWEQAGAEIGGEQEAAVRAEAVGTLALDIEAEASPHDLKPLYMRLSAAEEKLEKRTA